MTPLADPRQRWRERAEALVAEAPDQDHEHLLYEFDEREAIAAIDGGLDDDAAGQLAYQQVLSRLGHDPVRTPAIGKAPAEEQLSGHTEQIMATDWLDPNRPGPIDLLSVPQLRRYRAVYDAHDGEPSQKHAAGWRAAVEGWREYTEGNRYERRAHFPLWELAADLGPADLKGAPPRPKTPPKESPPAPLAKLGFDVPGFVTAFLGVHPKARAAIIAAAVEKGLSERRVGKLLESAEGQGKAHRWDMGKGRRVYYATRPQPKLTYGDDHGK